MQGDTGHGQHLSWGREDLLRSGCIKCFLDTATPVFFTCRGFCTLAVFFSVSFPVKVSVGSTNINGSSTLDKYMCVEHKSCPNRGLSTHSALCPTAALAITSKRGKCIFLRHTFKTLGALKQTDIKSNGRVAELQAGLLDICPVGRNWGGAAGKPPEELGFGFGTPSTGRVASHGVVGVGGSGSVWGWGLSAHLG